MNKAVKIWLDLSKNDLKSSTILYENGCFRNSYFLFQQATEKANKAFALLSGFLTEKEFKTIQHNQLKIYRKAIEKQKRQGSSLIQVLKSYPELSNHKIIKKINFPDYCKSLKKGIRHIDSLRNYDLVNISSKDLSILLKEIKELKDIDKEVFRNYENLFQDQMLGIADLIGKIGTKEAIKAKSECIEFINDKEQAKKTWNLIIEEFIPFIIDFSSTQLTLYVCAVITIQHSSLTRYPEDNDNPEQIYTKQLPLVEKQKEFMVLLNDAINTLDKINNTQFQ